MAFYHKLGKFPPKRHTQFRKENGDLYYEQLVGTEGFSDVASLTYHCHRPTMVKSVGEAYSVEPQIAIAKNLKSYSLSTFDVPPADDYLESRTALLVNNDCHISVAAPRKSMDYFYKNADADELIFIHKGTGKLKSMFGELPFEYGDYIVVPRGTIYQLEFDTEENRLLIVDSFSPIVFPKRYRNKHGQLLEDSPFCERDINVPENLQTHDELGDFKILIKKQGMMFPYTYASHPFDVIGWDGYYYPYSISIHDFEPITGRVHLPPPIHQTFEAHNFVICSFVPRLYDYHPLSIPAPYNHSNIDSDEVLYYVDGDFMSRNNISKGQITLHPGGIPHGPHPGATERSIGQTETEELAVMVDTFRPLQVTEAALKIDSGDYHKSWLEH